MPESTIDVGPEELRALLAITRRQFIWDARMPVRIVSTASAIGLYTAPPLNVLALFAVPGAFTPTCSAKHVPGYVDNYDTLKSKGIDAIACVSVNDAFVMGAWGKDQKADGKVHMLADGNGDFTRAIGLEFDASKFGMGKRSQRYSMIVDNGVVKTVNVEEPGAFEVSSAEHIITQLP